MTIGKFWRKSGHPISPLKIAMEFNFFFWLHFINSGDFDNRGRLAQVTSLGQPKTIKSPLGHLCLPLLYNKVKVKPRAIIKLNLRNQICIPYLETNIFIMMKTICQVYSSHNVVYGSTLLSSMERIITFLGTRPMNKNSFIIYGISSSFDYKDNSLIF